MLKKCRFSLWILCMVLLLLCGCQAPHIPEQTTEAGTPPPLAQGLPMPEQPGNKLVAYDPTREMYFFGCENVDATIYLDTSCSSGLTFYVISKRKLDTDSIQVSLPIVNSYTYRVSDMEDGDLSFRDTYYTALEEGEELGERGSVFWLPYYVYQSYVGVDFGQLGALWQKYSDEVQKRINGDESYSAATEVAAQNEFIAARDAAIPGFKALKADQTREFYVYSVTVSFHSENAVDEVVTELNLTIEGTQYSPFTGKIHLVPSAYPARYTVRKRMSDYPGMLTPGTGLYGDGIGRVHVFNITAKENLTLMEMIISDEQFSVLDLVVSIQSRKGNSSNFYWDGTSPIEVLEGDRVSVDVIFHSDNMDNFSYFQVMHPELVYSLEDQLYSEVADITCSSTIVINFHELYGIFFDGLDMESYYRDYHYPLFEKWRAEYAK